MSVKCSVSLSHKWGRFTEGMFHVEHFRVIALIARRGRYLLDVLHGDVTRADSNKNKGTLHSVWSGH